MDNLCAFCATPVKETDAQYVSIKTWHATCPRVDSTNSELKALRQHYEARLEAAEAVIEAIGGDVVDLDEALDNWRKVKDEA